MERIREHLGIDKWVLFGGSWGSTLALAYAQAHPQRVHGLILRGIFLCRPQDFHWFYQEGASRLFPDYWQDYIAPIPVEERGDLIAAYHRRLFSGNMVEEMRFARLWAQWENALASVSHDRPMGEGPSDYARAFARLENHYFVNAGFLEQDGWIMANRSRIEHIPAVIVQGRFDMICPPVAAHRLAQGWARADLRIVAMAGHALSEAGISEALVTAMDTLRGIHTA